VRYGAAQYGAVRYSTVRYGAAQYGAVRYGAVARARGRAGAARDRRSRTRRPATDPRARDEQHSAATVGSKRAAQSGGEACGLRWLLWRCSVVRPPRVTEPIGVSPKGRGLTEDGTRVRTRTKTRDRAA